ncbi:hypothetical protein KEM56_002831 [Ascosphaera pollenicola]|nr:hypothetical protein KEM56_002831 [Ascosphaera pollenicola]
MTFNKAKPDYTPMPSLSEELGIMFAFLASMVLTALIYALIWRRVQRRNAAEERHRREKLNATLRARENQLSKREREREAREVSQSIERKRQTGSPFSAPFLNSQENITADTNLSGSKTDHILRGSRSTDELGMGAIEARKDLSGLGLGNRIGIEGYAAHHSVNKRRPVYVLDGIAIQEVLRLRSQHQESGDI